MAASVSRPVFAVVVGLLDGGNMPVPLPGCIMACIWCIVGGGWGLSCFTFFDLVMVMSHVKS